MGYPETTPEPEVVERVLLQKDEALINAAVAVVRAEVGLFKGKLTLTPNELEFRRLAGALHTILTLRGHLGALQDESKRTYFLPDLSKAPSWDDLIVPVQFAKSEDMSYSSSFVALEKFRGIAGMFEPIVDPRILIMPEKEKPMTETEWILGGGVSAPNPSKMLEYIIKQGASERKLRLLGAGILLVSSHKSTLELDLLADGLPLSNKSSWKPGWGANTEYEPGIRTVRRLVGIFQSEGHYHVEPKVLSLLFHSIWGNPFRYQSICGVSEGISSNLSDLYPKGLCYVCNTILDWNAGSIPKYAEAIYNDRRWDEMSMLADMLEEAGCTEQHMIQHCRGKEMCTTCRGKGVLKCVVVDSWIKENEDGLVDKDCDLCKATGWIPLRSPYLRGDWVLDLLMGKE